VCVWCVCGVCVCVCVSGHSSAALHASTTRHPTCDYSVLRHVRFSGGVVLAYVQKLEGTCASVACAPVDAHTHARGRSTLSAYDQDAARGSDAWGKLYFHNTPFTDDGPYYAGLVTPVIHYCMGGVAISADGSVLREDGAPIKGLYAAGEVIGGLHGKNRLGGNALSECVVFGRVIGNRIASALSSSSSSASAGPPSSSREGFSLGDAPAESPAGEAGEVSRGGDGAKVISTAELAKHNTEESCWVSIDDKVYDFTDFLDEHPAGADAILKYAGRDGTEIFHAIHTAEMLEDFQAIGTLGKADEEVPSFEAPSFEAPSFEAPAPPSPSVESLEPPSFEIPVF